MTRKDFITLTFTLIGSGVALAACDSDNTTTTTGVGGNNGGAGTSGAAGHAGGAGGHGGAGGSTGSAGTTGAGGSGTSACTNPLPETQDPDGLLHTHTMMIPASTLDATTDQTFTTTSAMAPGGAAHAHMVTLTVAQLAVLKAGGNVDVPSSIAASHMHTYTVGCH